MINFRSLAETGEICLGRGRGVGVQVRADEPAPGPRGLQDCRGVPPHTHGCVEVNALVTGLEVVEHLPYHNRPVGRLIHTGT